MVITSETSALHQVFFCRVSAVFCSLIRRFLAFFLFSMIIYLQLFTIVAGFDVTECYQTSHTNWDAYFSVDVPLNYVMRGVTSTHDNRHELV